MENKTVFKAEFEADAPKRVDSIKIVWREDESYDASWLGDYSSQPKGKHSIDRKERGDQGRNEYQYFNPGNDYSDCTAKQRAEYIEKDYARMESLKCGDWCFMGCYAVAEVYYPTGNGSRRIEKLQSSGLWGIESDSSKEYFSEVEGEQLSDLKSHLEQFDIEWPIMEEQFSGQG